MSFYAVIDTNVFVSALLSSHSDAATVQLVQRMIEGEIIPLYSSETMNEYRNVLHRPKFKFDRAQIDYLLSSVEHFGLLIEPTATGEILPDMKDLPFYEVVMEKRREDDAYLVTGNIRHFPVKTFIVTPNEMLRIMDATL